MMLCMHLPPLSLCPAFPTLFHSLWLCVCVSVCVYFDRKMMFNFMWSVMCFDLMELNFYCWSPLCWVNTFVEEYGLFSKVLLLSFGLIQCISYSLCILVRLFLSLNAYVTFKHQLYIELLLLSTTVKQQHCGCYGLRLPVILRIL